MDSVEERIITKLSIKYNIPFRIMKEICHSQFEFVSRKIKEYDLKELSDEEVRNTKTNFRFRFIGTLYIPDNLLKRRFKKKEDGNRD